jgi:hypothetical protein
MSKRKLSTQQIGKCGELLVQYKLLLQGIESAPLTTDAGVDLVAYSDKKKDAITIQVKTNMKAKPGGGKGKLVVDWWLPENTSAYLYAFVRLDSNKVWLIETSLLSKLAQQHPKGRYHFFMTHDPTAKPRRDGKTIHEYDFERYLLENRVHELF